MKTVLVLFGGKSSEYEVSLRSSASVLRNIPSDRYETVKIGITKDGRWLYTEAAADEIENNTWIGKTERAVISPDFGSKEIMIFGEDGIRTVKVDVCFPVLHGRNGEDGTVQGLLTVAGIPFVGCDTLSDAMCMDKGITNTIADHIGIPQAKWLQILECDYRTGKDDFLGKVASYLGFPAYVKPANAGSSVGITKAHTPEELETAMETAFVHDRKVVVEESITGHEVECAVLGNDDPEASVVGQIKPCNEFYDYEAKYAGGSTELLIPAAIRDDAAGKIREAAVTVFKAMGCSGLSRVDFFALDDGSIRFNEINTLPGFTSISMYPKLFDACGISYPELISRLIVLAEERMS